jgi:hypothetical protein
MASVIRHHECREVSITEASEVSAEAWSTDTVSTRPAVINSAIAL